MPADTKSADLGNLTEFSKTFDSFSIDSTESAAVGNGATQITKGNLGLVIFPFCVIATEASCGSGIYHKAASSTTTDIVVFLGGNLSIEFQW